MRIQYDDFVANAPPSWLKDGWLQQHIPISVACRYGQNQPIASTDRHALRVEARNWNLERDYTNIRYMSMAIATHISYVFLVSPFIPFSVLTRTLSHPA